MKAKFPLFLIVSKTCFYGQTWQSRLIERGPANQAGLQKDFVRCSFAVFGRSFVGRHRENVCSPQFRFL